MIVTPAIRSDEDRVILTRLQTGVDGDEKIDRYFCQSER